MGLNMNLKIVKTSFPPSSVAVTAAAARRWVSFSFSRNSIAPDHALASLLPRNRTSKLISSSNRAKLRQRHHMYRQGWAKESSPGCLHCLWLDRAGRWDSRNLCPMNKPCPVHLNAHFPRTHRASFENFLFDALPEKYFGW